MFEVKMDGLVDRRLEDGRTLGSEGARASPLVSDCRRGPFLEFSDMKLGPGTLKRNECPFTIDSNHRCIPWSKRLVRANSKCVALAKVQCCWS